MSASQRYLVLITCFLAIVFDGVELGLMPVASLSVSKSLLGTAFTPELGGEWFARFTAALMLGAAIGGIALGNLGDRIGRTRAMGVCILFYSVFAALGAMRRRRSRCSCFAFSWASAWVVCGPTASHLSPNAGRVRQSPSSLAR
jgi:MFS family permease